MKTNFLLLFIFCAAISSCSTLYRSGQTPDDLYAAKGKVVADEDTQTSKDNRANDDYSIRLGVTDPRWRELNDYDYSPYGYGYNYGYYYNPCYYPYPVYSPWVFTNPKNTAIRKTNLDAYSHTINMYTPVKTGGTIRTISIRGYNVGNNNSGRPTVDYNSTRSYNPNNNSNSSSNSNSNSNSNNNSGSSSGSSISRPSRGR